MSAADEQYAKKLIERYVAGDASEKELQAFFGLLTEAEIDSLIEEHMGQEILRLREEQRLLMPVRRFRFWKYAAVVFGFLMFSYGGYYFLRSKPTLQIAQTQKQDFNPGRNQATLTLSNGQKIVLTKGLNGKLAQQGNTSINVNSGNAIAYQVSAQNVSAPIITYNTLSTAKGEQSPYPLILADGSKVWLNAASSITFPTAFNGKERIVKITGEAYFEVVHNAAQPFKVTVNDQVIEDVGTHFDINAYSDEPAITTTLLEGAVNISLTGSNHTVSLTAGQQSVVQAGAITKLSDANISVAMGWREGHFRFKDAGIKEVMRQFARWYDVDVVYEGQIPKFAFTGALHRDIKASQALEVLSIFKVHYKIDGKKIIITP